MSATLEHTDTSSLKARWEELKTANPQLRIRDAAAQLGVSEMDLLLTNHGEGVTTLEADWTELLQRLPGLGRVMSLTRSDACVLEHKGHFGEIEIMQHGPSKIATVIGPIETRVFLNVWKYGFYVENNTPRGLWRSLQFFDATGQAITKIYAQEGTDMGAFEKLVSDYQTSNIPELKTADTAHMTPATPNFDREAFRNDWENLQDTHDFHLLLRKYRIDRLTALGSIGEDFAIELDRECLGQLLERVAADQIPVMIFAGNKGNLQIHQDVVRTVRKMDNWLNVFDPEFNMHLDTNLIRSVWLVRKPTRDGMVTGIECFGYGRELEVQFFGLRKPGLPEREDWRALAESLPNG